MEGNMPNTASQSSNNVPLPAPDLSAETARQKVYTMHDLVEALRLSRATIQKLLSSGKLKSRALGGRTVVTEADLQAFVDSLPVKEPTI
jgi:helix-turn-helix protein